MSVAMEGSLEDGIAASIIGRNLQVVLQDELGVLSSVIFCCGDEGSECFQVILVADIDARLCQVLFSRNSFYGFRETEIDAVLVRIHFVIVVNRDGIASRHGNREDYIIETVHGNTQLYAITVHEVVGWDIQIIEGLVIDATGKEVCAVFVNLVALLVGIL